MLAKFEVFVLCRVVCRVLWVSWSSLSASTLLEIRSSVRDNAIVHCGDRE